MWPIVRYIIITSNSPAQFPCLIVPSPFRIFSYLRFYIFIVWFRFVYDSVSFSFVNTTISQYTLSFSNYMREKFQVTGGGVMNFSKNVTEGSMSEKSISEINLTPLTCVKLNAIYISYRYYSKDIFLKVSKQDKNSQGTFRAENF